MLQCQNQDTIKVCENFSGGFFVDFEKSLRGWEIHWEQINLNLLECILINQQLREVCGNFFLAVKGKNTEENSVKLSFRKKIMSLKKSSTKTD